MTDATPHRKEWSQSVTPKSATLEDFFGEMSAAFGLHYGLEINKVGTANPHFATMKDVSTEEMADIRNNEHVLVHPDDVHTYDADRQELHVDTGRMYMLLQCWAEENLPKLFASGITIRPNDAELANLEEAIETALKSYKEMGLIQKTQPLPNPEELHAQLEAAFTTAHQLFTTPRGFTLGK